MLNHEKNTDPLYCGSHHNIYIYILCLCCAAALLLALPVSAASVDDPSGGEESSAALIYQVKTPIGVCDQIMPTEIENMGIYLFLPSSADYEKLDLFAPAGTVLLNRENSAEFVFSADEETVDLTRLFGGMQPGESYLLTCRFPEEQEQEIHVIKSANLASIHIKTDNPRGIEWLNESKDNADTGELVKVEPDGTSSKILQVETIKGRGNSTWYGTGNKKPYNIKLAKNNSVELIAGAGTARNWCLLSNARVGADTTGLTNIIAYNLYQTIGGDFPLSTESADLYINGDYRGTYFLTEKVEADAARVDIVNSRYRREDKNNVVMIASPDAVVYADFSDGNSLMDLSDAVAPDFDDIAINAGILAYQYSKETELKRSQGKGGYLLELDFRLDQPCWFVTAHNVKINLREPKYATKEQVQEIAAFVQNFENALFTENRYNSSGIFYSDYVDLESLTKYLSVEIITANGDAMGGSTYMSVDIDGTTSHLLGEEVPVTSIKFGPVWDFDQAVWNCPKLFWADSIGEFFRLCLGSWLSEFYKKGDLMAALSKTVCGEVRSEWSVLTDGSGKMNEYINKIAISKTMDYIRWANELTPPGKERIDFAADAEEVKAGMIRRYHTLFDEETGLFSDNYLLGLTVCEAEEGVLKANVTGKAAGGITWRQAGVTQPVGYGDAFSPEEDGDYYATALGIVNGGPITMTSNTLSYREAPDALSQFLNDYLYIIIDGFLLAAVIAVSSVILKRECGGKDL